MTKNFELTDEEQTMIYMALDYLHGHYVDFYGDKEKTEKLWRKFRPGAV